ncbi:MAG: glutamate racemase [Verrucomicrobia bacterium]|nr:glutamate racemase [Verrucomicrobiota bacterium]
MKRASIGIFDSGFGGLTVMNAVKNLLPHEDIIYFGDTANLPYGNKSVEAISGYCVKNTEFLLSLGIKLLIMACHTACASSYDLIENMSPIPVVGVINPSLDLIKKHAKTGKVALLGTRRTIQSEVYQKLIASTLPQSEVTSIACPLFVPIVEEGYANHPIAESIVQEYLEPLKEKQIEALLLGCTHYPLLQKFIQKRLHPSTILIDPSIECARQTQEILQSRNLLNENTDEPNYTFYVSDDTEKFQLFGKNFFPHPMKKVISTQFSL